MATIKAGTYTLKEVLTLPTERTSEIYETIAPTPITIGDTYYSDVEFINVYTDSVTINYEDRDLVAYLYRDGKWEGERENIWVIGTDITVSDALFTWFNDNLVSPYYEITATSAEGVVLHTEGKLVDKDIKVTFPNGGGETYEEYSGSYEITENGTVACANKVMAQDLTVNVEASGGDNPLTATTDTEMNALLVTENVGKVARFNGTSDTYVDGGYYLIEAVEPEGYKLTITVGAIASDVQAPQMFVGSDPNNDGSFTYLVSPDSTASVDEVFIIPKETPYVKIWNAWSQGWCMLNGYSGAVESVNSFMIKLTGDAVITDVMMCLTGDTLVTMADRTEKRLDEIEVGDYILSYDWGTMSLVPNKVIYTDKDMNKTHTEYDVWTFDDGSVIKTVHRHRFFNVERKAFVYMDEWKIGEHTVKIDGTMPMLISHETITETVNHYKITGELGTNYFANGLLTGDRYCPTEIDFEEVQNG